MCTADQRRFAYDMAESYMGAGHLTEARTFLDSISSAALGNISFMGQLGVAAALQGDTVTARECANLQAVLAPRE